MRVLHVIPSIAARYGGPSVVAVETVRALRRAGCEATIATTDADGAGRLDVPRGEITDWSGVPTVFFSRTASEAFKWSPSLARWLRRHVAGFDVVDVHAIFSHSSLAAAGACAASGVPYVLRPHGALDPWSLGRRRLQKRALLAAGASRMLAGAARMLHATPAEQTLAERAMPNLARGAVVPLGVADDYFADPILTHEDPYVLVMSRLEKKKHVEVMIDAFHQMGDSPEVRKWRLVLAGEGHPSYVDELKSRARAGAAAARITFAGWVAGPVKMQLLREAAVFASPSAQENFGLSVMEAMACGVPVLVTPEVNLAPEVAACNAGWVVPSGEVAERLRAIVVSGDKRRERAVSARTVAERYRWSASATVLRQVYDDVAGVPGAASGNHGA